MIPYLLAAFFFGFIAFPAINKLLGNCVHKNGPWVTDNNFALELVQTRECLKCRRTERRLVDFQGSDRMNSIPMPEGGAK